MKKSYESYYNFKAINDGSVSTEPLEVKKKIRRAASRKTGDTQEQINLCLNCTRKNCSGSCVAVKNIKKNKDNPKTESRLCGDCPECKYNGDYNLYYCVKYRQVVDKTDLCVEVGYDEVFGGK